MIKKSRLEYLLWPLGPKSSLVGPLGLLGSIHPPTHNRKSCPAAMTGFGHDLHAHVNSMGLQNTPKWMYLHTLGREVRLIFIIGALGIGRNTLHACMFGSFQTLDDDLQDALISGFFGQ